MSSERKKESARANGAKSCGPKTPEGKARSARNAVKYGFNARVVVLDNESEERFNQLRDSYLAELAPRNRVEADLVDQIVVATWRLQRNWSIETSLINAEIVRQRREVDADYSRIDEPTRTAFALQAEADHSRALALLNRYEVRDQRIIRRSLETLRELRQDAENIVVQNEPSPVPEHPCEPPLIPPPPPLSEIPDPTLSEPGTSEPQTDPQSYESIPDSPFPPQAQPLRRPSGYRRFPLRSGASWN